MLIIKLKLNCLQLILMIHQNFHIYVVHKYVCIFIGERDSRCV